MNEKKYRLKDLMNFKPLPTLITLCIGFFLFFLTPPNGVDPKAMQLMAIFVATIVGVIVKAMPMGQLSLLGITLLVLTKTLSIDQALSGISTPVSWLIVMAFFISRGIIKTGLGKRLAYFFIALFGKRTLGLAYGITLADTLLAPAIPSNTARAGGVIFPIVKSLSQNFGSVPEDGTQRKVGSYLMKVAFQGNVITSALFLTSMASNPLMASFCQDQGVTLTFFSWFLYASVPGILALLFVPYFIYKVYPPDLKETKDAPLFAKKKLQEMGPISPQEIVMLITFVVLITLWILGGLLGGLSATTVAILGLVILLLTGVLTWDDVVQEKSAWDTLIWFTTLLMMASFLNKLGFISFLGVQMTAPLSHLSWPYAFLFLSIGYFFSHYFFASSTSHVSSMFPVFLGVGISLGVPPYLMALTLCLFSNLYGGITHYGNGPAPILFAANYVEMKDWWKLGFYIALINIAIFLGVGSLWWKVLGLY